MTEVAPRCTLGYFFAPSSAEHYDRKRNIPLFQKIDSQSPSQRSCRIYSLPGLCNRFFFKRIRRSYQTDSRGRFRFTKERNPSRRPERLRRFGDGTEDDKFPAGCRI